MDTREALQKRRSVRKYEPDVIDRVTVQRLIDAAILAPSNMNNQPWHFHIVSGAKRDGLVKILNRSTLMLADIFASMDKDHADKATEFFSDVGGAPVIIVVSVPDSAGEEYQRQVDILGCGCAVQNLLLAAYAEGLGSCVLTISFWVKDDIAKYLKIQDRDIICCILVGKPGETPETPPRQGNVVSWVGT